MEIEAKVDGVRTGIIVGEDPGHVKIINDDKDCVVLKFGENTISVDAEELIDAVKRCTVIRI